MQLYESSFYSFVSAEARNWLPEIIVEERERNGKSEAARFLTRTRLDESESPTSRLRNRGFNCEGGDCEELLLLFSFVINTRDLLNVDIRYFHIKYTFNATFKYYNFK